MKKKLKNLFWFVYLIFCLFGYSSLGHSSGTLSEDTWLSAQNGRASSFIGSFLAGDIEKFVPSGRNPTSQVIGDYKVTIYHPVYSSDEENSDIQKDIPASIIVSYEGSVIFVGKGHKFLLIDKLKKQDPLFIIRHWVENMGCHFMDLIFYPEKVTVIDNRKSSSFTDVALPDDRC